MITKVFVKFDKLHGETPRAFYLYFNELGRAEWFPKRFCWNFILNKKLGGNMIIPTWLYKEKFNKEPDKSNQACTIEKHIPEHKEPVTINPDANLIR
jgi:hypothetical protein